MATLLTWLNGGLGTKVGTTNADFINDFVATFNANLANPNYLWQVASSSTAGNPHSIVLKPKSGAAGRILVVLWTSAPAGNNSAILDVAPTTNTAYLAWFPNGNVDTPSNLTAASGTIMGSDANAVKCVAMGTISTIYAAGLRPFYFDSAEAIWLGTQDPTSATLYGAGAGNILVDGGGTAYGGVYGSSTAGFAFHLFGQGGTLNSTCGWSSSSVSAGSTSPCIRTNYGSANRVYFHAFKPSGAWAAQAVSSSDVLTDTANTKAWFVPVVLLGLTKGEGFALRLRQVAFGPGASSAFSAYSTTGPVVAARQFNAATAGGSGYPWMTNFEV
jgi:hypothetical protein